MVSNMDLSALLPTLGNAMSGNIGGAINEGLKVFGINPSGDVKKDKRELEKAMEKATPEQVERLKELEVELKKVEVESQKVHAQDRSSAREMYVANKSKTPDIIAYVVVGGFFLALFLLIFTDLKENPMVMMMFGVLGAEFTRVLNFYFGSSKSSQNKDEKIARMTY